MFSRLVLSFQIFRILKYITILSSCQLTPNQTMKSMVHVNYSYWLGYSDGCTLTYFQDLFNWLQSIDLISCHVVRAGNPGITPKQRTGLNVKALALTCFQTLQKSRSYLQKLVAVDTKTGLAKVQVMCLISPSLKHKCKMRFSCQNFLSGNRVHGCRFIKYHPL